MSDQSRDLRARAELIKETSEKLARRMNLEFVVDADKLKTFLDREVDETELASQNHSGQPYQNPKLHLI